MKALEFAFDFVNFFKLTFMIFILWYKIENKTSKKLKIKSFIWPKLYIYA